VGITATEVNLLGIARELIPRKDSGFLVVHREVALSWAEIEAFSGTPKLLGNVPTQYVCVVWGPEQLTAGALAAWSFVPDFVYW